MSDSIDRQAAIDALDTIHYTDREDWWAVLSTVENLPSVTPKQRTGKWIKTARWGKVYYCNQCRNYLDFDGVNVGRGNTNFCPNCGADMREVSNGN